MSTARNAILKAKLEGVITELMVKTDAANVYVDDNTTLATKLTSIIADIATKASTTDLTNGLATKADTKHTHAQSDITGLTDALAKLASSESVTAAIDALRQEMLGDTPVEAYNTFTELAAYIAEHQEVSDALSAAIGTKADKATTLSGYGITDAYTKTQVDGKITTVTNAASAAQTAADTAQNTIDTYKTSNDARVTALEGNSHTHSNKDVLDGISKANVAAWNAKGLSTVYYSETEPSAMTANDLWVQPV